MDNFKDKNCKLKFYSHRKVSSGYKFRNAYLKEGWTIMELDLSSYEFEDLDYKLLIEKIKNNHFDREEFIEKDYRRNNSLGEYYDEEYYDGPVDFIESLDFDVFVEVSNI